MEASGLMRWVGQLGGMRGRKRGRKERSDLKVDRRLKKYAEMTWNTHV